MPTAPAQERSSASEEAAETTAAATAATEAPEARRRRVEFCPHVVVRLDDGRGGWASAERHALAGLREERGAMLPAVWLGAQPEPRRRDQQKRAHELAAAEAEELCKRPRMAAAAAAVTLPPQ